MRASLLIALTLTSCAPSLLDDYPFDGETNTGPLVKVTTDADGLMHAVIDATNKGSQVYFDIDNSTEPELKAAEAFATNAWDLSFQRFVISMNGGAGNPQGVVKVAVLKDVPFDTLTQAPETGWVQDGSGDPVFNSVEGGWYYYDLSKHRLTAITTLVYVIRSTEAKFYKLRMDRYYDDSGTPAMLSFTYAAVAAPSVVP
jgi:hypothetical protein